MTQQGIITIPREGNMRYQPSNSRRNTERHEEPLNFHNQQQRQLETMGSGIANTTWKSSKDRNHRHRD